MRLTTGKRTTPDFTVMQLVSVGSGGFGNSHSHKTAGAVKILFGLGNVLNDQKAHTLAQMNVTVAEAA